MLNRTSLHAAFAQAKKYVLGESINYRDLLKQTWDALCANSEFQKNVEEAEFFMTLPSWHKPLQTSFEVNAYQNPYSILTIDGSQIYPDRHLLQVQHALIHVAGLVVMYDEKSFVQLFSYPFVIDLYHEEQEKERISAEWINLEREALEYERGLQEALRIKKETGQAPFLLFDGSLLWYHLGSLSDEQRIVWFNRYHEIFKRLHEEQVLYASYLSAPQNRDLIGLLQVQLCRFKRAACKPCRESYDTFPCQIVGASTDRNLVEVVLPQNHWMQWFYTQKTKKLPYDKNLQPCFTYYHGAHEVARVEVPAWIADNDDFSQKVLSIITDQVDKGFGYPVLVAEAHEQAVVKEADKEYFYTLSLQLQGQTFEKQRYSYKSLKKRQMPC